MNKVDKKKIIEMVKNRASEKTVRKNPTKTASINPTKKDVYDTFVLWYSIPLAVKNLSEPERQKLNLTELAMTLSSIRTQEQFCKTYNVHRDTLNEWKNKTSWNELDTGMKKWLKMLTANWRLAVYKKVMRTGNSPEAFFLEKIINDYTEKTTIKHTGLIYNLPDEKVEDIKNSFRKNAHRRTKR